MGNQVCTYPERPPNFTIFSLTFCWDTIKLIDTPDDIVDLICATITTTYIRGIQRVTHSRSGNSVLLKLSGFPFTVNSSKETAVAAKLMLCALLEKLHSNGWELVLSSDLSRLHDFSTLFFQKVPNACYMDCKIMCLSLSAFDRLQLINAPVEVHAALVACAGDLLQKQSTDERFFEVQLKGNLWVSVTSFSDFLAQDLLLNCFIQFQKLHYRYFGTANIKGTADCIFFISDNEEVGERDYCLLSLNRNDRIRLISAPPEVIQTVGKCIEEQWTKGIQKAELKEGGVFYEYKLGGYPWLSYGIEAVESRYLITVVLQQMVRIGWAVVTALDVSRRPNDKAVFLFRRCMAANIPHFAICPAGYDRIRIINADKETLQFVEQLIRTNWTAGIQKDGLYGNSFEIKLVGYPWAPSNSGEAFELSRMMMARLLHGLALRGWKVICSADISSKHNSNVNGNGGDALDMHSWFVAYTGHSLPSDSNSRFFPISAVQPPPFCLIYPGDAPPAYEDAVNGVS